jgi:hypothetical protein
LYNVTAGAAVSESELFVAFSPTAGTYAINTATLTKVITVGAASTIRLEAALGLADVHRGVAPDGRLEHHAVRLREAVPTDRVEEQARQEAERLLVRGVAHLPGGARRADVHEGEAAALLWGAPLEGVHDAARDAVEGDRAPHDSFEPEHEHGRRPHHSSNPAITAAHRTGSTSTTGGTARTTPTVNAKVASITTAACPAVRHVQTPTQREQHAPGW